MGAATRLAALAGVHADPGRRYAVCHLVVRPEEHLRGQRQDGRSQVDLPARSAQGHRPVRVLRREQPRRRLQRRQDIPRPAGRAHRGTRRQDRQGTVEDADRRLHRRLGHHLAAHARQEPRHHRVRRRRIRCSWRHRRARPGDRQGSLAHPHRADGQRARSRLVEGRLGQERRRRGVAHRLVRPEAQPRVLRHQQPVAVVGHRARQRQLGHRQVQQPLHRVDPRAQPRHRQDHLALPDHAARRLGLRRRERTGVRRPAVRRQEGSGADAGQPQRLLLCHRPRQRQAAVGQAVRGRRELGHRHRHEDRRADRDRGQRQAPRHEAQGKRCLSEPDRRQELDADELRQGHRPGLYPDHQPVHGHGRDRCRVQARRVLPRRQFRPRQDGPGRPRRRRQGLGSGQAADGLVQQGRTALYRRDAEHRRRAGLPR